eukprot:scaffold24848_cov174-Isochrysis_galbana.AAC.1
MTPPVPMCGRKMSLADSRPSPPRLDWGLKGPDARDELRRDYGTEGPGAAQARVGGESSP